MDPLTHMVLGGTLAHAALSRRARLAVVAGVMGALLPDVDVFLSGQGSSVAGYVLHRHFTHALLLVPVVALIAAVPFAFFRATRRQWPLLYLAALLGAATHGVLDAATAYGTHLLWPFSNARTSWDVISVIDPIFTAVLTVGLVRALRRHSVRPALAALILGAAYMGLAIVQHERALSAQRQLAAERGHTAVRGRVIPLLGHIFAWRSIYEKEGVLHADAIQVWPFTAPRISRGEAVNAYRVDDAERAARLSPSALADLRLFSHFADGYVALVPGRPDLIGDMRYATPANSFRSLWAVRFHSGNPDSEPALVHLTRENLPERLRLLWRDIRGATRPLGAEAEAN